jgi:hypothetical protein
MTAIEVQAILTTINGHIDGKSGSIINLNISNGAATVQLDWPAFVSNFSTQNADRSNSANNPIWTKVVGAITYQSKQPLVAPTSDVVPAS